MYHDYSINNVIVMTYNDDLPAENEIRIESPNNMFIRVHIHNFFKGKIVFKVECVNGYESSEYVKIFKDFKEFKVGSNPHIENNFIYIGGKKFVGITPNQITIRIGGERIKIRI